MNLKKQKRPTFWNRGNTTLCDCIENINLKYLIDIGLGQAIFSKTELHQTGQITFLIATWSTNLYFNRYLLFFYHWI